MSKYRKHIHNLQLQPEHDYAPHLMPDSHSSVHLGYDGQVYWLTELQDPDHYEMAENGVWFPKITPVQPPDYRVQAFAGEVMTLDITITGAPLNLHFLQPLPQGELLLVCSRSQYRGKDDYDRNALVYSREGVLLRSFLLGDGIGHVQTTERGIIWAGYFDEGIFGNFGWDGGTIDGNTGKYLKGPKPVGRDGLLAWNAHGKVLYRYRQSEAMMALRMYSICDCYALNTASVHDTWLYYYHSFPLVHLHNRKIAGYWKMPVEGSGVFAVTEGHALFSGGYKQPGVFHLLSLGATGSKARVKARLHLQDESGKPFSSARILGRANTLSIFRSRQLYTLTVEEVLKQTN